MPELYNHILSDRCYTARLALSLLGVACEKKTVDYTPTRTPESAEVVAINPAGTIPVLVDGDAVLTDIRSILEHLASHYDTAGKWRASDPEVTRWLDFSTGPLTALHESRKLGVFGAYGDREALVRRGRDAMRTVDDHLTAQALEGKHWLVDDSPTLAEIAVFPSVMLSHDAGIGHEDYPAINLWQRRVRRLPGFLSMPGIPDYF